MELGIAHVPQAVVYSHSLSSVIKNNSALVDASSRSVSAGEAKSVEVAIAERVQQQQRHEFFDHSYSPHTVYFAVPSSCVGSIIGKGGKLLREMQAEFNVKVYVEKDDYLGQRIVSLTPCFEQVSADGAAVDSPLTNENNINCVSNQLLAATAAEGGMKVKVRGREDLTGNSSPLSATDDRGGTHKRNRTDDGNSNIDPVLASSSAAAAAAAVGDDSHLHRTGSAGNSSSTNNSNIKKREGADTCDVDGEGNRKTARLMLSDRCSSLTGVEPHASVDEGGGEEEQEPEEGDEKEEDGGGVELDGGSVNASIDRRRGSECVLSTEQELDVDRIFPCRSSAAGNNNSDNDDESSLEKPFHSVQQHRLCGVLKEQHCGVICVGNGVVSVAEDIQTALRLCRERIEAIVEDTLQKRNIPADALLTQS